MFGRKAKKSKKWKKPWKMRKYEFFHPITTRRAKSFVKDAKRKGWI